MKIPKYIQKKMHRVAKMYKEAHELMEEIEGYIEDNCGKVESEAWRLGNGISLEELESGNDVTEEFVKWAESDFDALKSGTD